MQKAVNEANKIFNSYKRMCSLVVKGDFKKAAILLTRKFLFCKIFRSLQKEFIPFLENLEKEYYVNDKLNVELLREKEIKRMPQWE